MVESIFKRKKKNEENKEINANDCSCWEKKMDPHLYCNYVLINYIYYKNKEYGFVKSETCYAYKTSFWCSIWHLVEISYLQATCLTGALV